MIEITQYYRALKSNIYKIIPCLILSGGLIRAEAPDHQHEDVVRHRRPVNSNQPDSFNLPERWFTQRDQGQAGTCHAFATIPTIDAIENKVNPQGPSFSTSENWIVFASVLDQLCKTSGKVRTGDGYFPERNLRSILNIGYCSKEKYNDYSTRNLELPPELLPAGVANPIEYFKGKLNKQSDIDLGEKREQGEQQGFFGGKKQEGKLKEYGIQERPSISNTHGYIGPGSWGEYFGFWADKDGEIAKKFEAAFGIGWQEATKLLCNVSAKAPLTKEQINRVTASDQFKSCLSEAVEKNKKLTEKKCAIKEYGATFLGPDKMTFIKQALKSGAPVVVSMHNYRPRKEGHSYHAISIVGYADGKNKNEGEFKVINSWGSGQNFPIPYSRLSDVLALSYLSCEK